MNILQILPELRVGGGETGTLDLSRHLVYRGHKAVVVSNGGPLVEKLDADGAIHYRLPVHSKSIITMARMVPKLVEIIRKEDIQIVHARSRVPAWIAYFACRLTNTVFVTTCHGYYSVHPFSRVMGWGKRVIAISNSIVRHMADDFGVPEERIRLVPRSVDLEKFTFTSPETKRDKTAFNVGIIGRITPLKGHRYFLRAMAELAAYVPGLSVWVVGDAPDSKRGYKAKLLALADELGLSCRARFLGIRRDVADILAHLDLLVLATTAPEAFGRVIVEAQASGVPVVATRVGGVVDIIEDGRTGLLVPPADHHAIAAAALRIFREREAARQMAWNAYSKAREQYNLERMVSSTLRVYEEALSDQRVLILKFTTVGDMVLATAALRAIREKFRGARISILASPETEGLLLRCPYVDEVLVYDRRNRGGIGGLWRLGCALRKYAFDTVIDLQNNRKSHILSFLCGARARYGYDNGKYGFLLNFRMKDTKSLIDPVTHQFRMLAMAGVRADNQRLELWPGGNDHSFISEFLCFRGVCHGQKIIGVNISASPRWVAKSWPLHHLARLCSCLKRAGIRVVVTGMGYDRDKSAALKRMAPEADIIDGCGVTTVNQLACLISRCRVYVSADSAPLHIAVSQGTPCVALFGPTDYRRHLPPAKNCVVIDKRLPCGPCYDSGCTSRECMEEITPEDVLQAIHTLDAGLFSPEDSRCGSH